MKIYIVTGTGATVKAFTNREKAEEEAKKQTYNIECSGSHGSAYVKEVVLVED